MSDVPMNVPQPGPTARRWRKPRRANFQGGSLPEMLGDTRGKYIHKWNHDSGKPEAQTQVISNYKAECKPRESTVQSSIPWKGWGIGTGQQAREDTIKNPLQEWKIDDLGLFVPEPAMPGIPAASVEIQVSPIHLTANGKITYFLGDRSDGPNGGKGRITVWEIRDGIRKQVFNTPVTSTKGKEVTSTFSIQGDAMYELVLEVETWREGNTAWGYALELTGKKTGQVCYRKPIYKWAPATEE